MIDSSDQQGKKQETHHHYRVRKYGEADGRPAHQKKKGEDYRILDYMEKITNLLARLLKKVPSTGSLTGNGQGHKGASSYRATAGIYMR